jgi:FKBP-type peptidyl-prolyl cis-trans isomerase
LGIGKFIKGLDAGISTMRIGEKATFIISSDKGYGNKKVGIVPANSTLYYDIELVSETNPFLTFPALDTILLNENMKLLIERNNGSEFQVDKVLECNLLTYYKNAEGINVILTDSKLTSTPVYVLYNSKLISSDLLLAMRYFKSKENGLIIMPLNKAVELKGQVQNSGAQYIYYQLSNIRILDYPFFPIIQSDTIYTEEKVKYQIVKKGNETGSSFTNNSVIKLAYTGYFMDNSKKVIFSTSRESGKPLEYNFNTETIIRGLVIGSREMKMGEARKVYIPYTLAYGEKGVPAAGIPPKTDLIFEIEAVNIIKQ